MGARSKLREGGLEILNRKVSQRYFILERFEAGIVLWGTEIKSLREGKAQIAEAFVRIDRLGRPWMHNAHVESYSHGTDANHSAVRARELLLHRREINRLRVAAEKEGMTLIPLRLHIEHGLAKVDVGLCKGKQFRDRREDLRRETAMREAQKAIADRIRGKHP
ncbi:MAG: SsrA-binding protein SmpB [Puniceicoccales bacterium]|jgi:SsrA-binding protein|nr:SsrA-binding protein SmpB [Puniceicoccales bacterium]